MMRPSAPRTGARLLGMLACLAGPAAAQQKQPLKLDVDVGVGFVTANIDRGVLLSNLPQLTPHLRVAVKPGGGRSKIILGFTGLAELTSPRDSTKFGLAADSLKRPNLAEVQPSLTFVQGLGKSGVAAIDVGATYRMFPNVDGVTSLNNMGIFRVGLGAPGAPIPVRVGFVYETGALEGSSLEASLGGDFRAADGTAVVLRADAGYQVDLRANAGTSARLVPIVRRRGFSYVDMTAGLDLVVGGAAVRPLVTVTYAQDTLGTVPPLPGAAVPYRWLGRFGVSLGIRKSLPKPAPPPPPAKGARPAAGPRPAAGAKPAAKKP